MYNSDEHFKKLLKQVEDESRRVRRVYNFAMFLFGLMVGTSIVVGIIRAFNG